MTLNPYKILKISRDAPDEVIRAAYKVLASKYHPDKNPGDEISARIMQQINDAYALLSDPIQRSAYDRNSTGNTDSPATEQPNSDSKRVTIYCRNCRRALRVAEDVLSAPERFKVACPGCRKDPFAEPERPQEPSQDLSKSIINCKHCNQSIRVTLAAIQQPDRFDVICPKCNLNPLSEISNYKYTQSQSSYIKPSYTIYPAIQKYSTPKFFTTSIKFIKSFFLGFISFVKTTFFIIILIGGISVLFEFFSKNSSDYYDNRPSTIKTTSPQTKSTFSQPVLPLPQTGDTTASFNNGAAPLSIKTSPNGGYNYFVKIVNTTNNRELGGYFIRSGEVLETKVPVGNYEIRYASGKQWYGTGYLFGPETRYSKAESIFTFNFDGYQYSGYTIELIMQNNGNLRTSEIQPSQW